MPLLRFDIFEGRSPDQLKALLNATHSALVAAFRIPERDRYQIVHEHPASHFIVQDTGLGIPRTKSCVLLQITTRPRERRAKEVFYHLLCESLKKECAHRSIRRGRIDGHEFRRGLVIWQGARPVSDG